MFVVGNDEARVYLRYSKIHSGSHAFFGLRQADLRELEGRNSFLCFFTNDGSPPIFVPYADFEEVFRSAEVAGDGQYKVQLVSIGGLGNFIFRASDGLTLTDIPASKRSRNNAPETAQGTGAFAVALPGPDTLAGIGRAKGVRRIHPF